MIFGIKLNLNRYLDTNDIPDIMDGIHSCGLIEPKSKITAIKVYSDKNRPYNYSNSKNSVILFDIIKPSHFKVYKLLESEDQKIYPNGNNQTDLLFQFKNISSSIFLEPMGFEIWHYGEWKENEENGIVISPNKVYFGSWIDFVDIYKVEFCYYNHKMTKSATMKL